MISTQDILPINSYNKNGIIEYKGRYSLSINIKDINYSLNSDESQADIFLTLCEIYNMFGDNKKIQVTLANENVILENITSKLTIDKKDDNLNIYREEFNSVMVDSLATARNGLKKSITITISDKYKNMEAATRKLFKIYREISSKFNRIECKIEVLNLEERGRLLYGMLRLGEEEDYIYDINNFKDCIAPGGINFNNKYFTMNGRYYGILYVPKLSTSISDTFTNDIIEISSNIIITSNIEGESVDTTIDMLNKKSTILQQKNIKKQNEAAKNGRYSYNVDFNLKDKMNKVDKYKDMIMNKNQKNFKVSYTIIYSAENINALKELKDDIISAARIHLVKLKDIKLNKELEKCLISTIPFGYVEDLKNYRLPLTTEALTCTTLFFNGTDYFDKQGKFYGINSLTGNVIIIDKDLLKNRNSFVLGSPGSGKSFATKEEIVSEVLSKDGDIFIIDPNDEYGELSRSFGGEVIEISVNSKTHLNPLDLTEDPEDDAPVKSKSDFLFTIFTGILATGNQLSNKEKAILDKVTHRVYTKYIANGFLKEEQPTLREYLEILKSLDEKEAKDLAISLDLYVNGSLDLFSHPTNVNTKSRIQVYNIQKLGSGLKTLGLQICLEHIWNKVIENRKKGKETYVVCDEVHLLFGEGNSYSAKYLERFYKQARKYDAGITCISQNITGMLQDPIAAQLIANTEFLQILSQSQQDKNLLIELLRLSDMEAGYISNVDPGSGLLVIGQTQKVPFTNKFPKNTKLYELMTTDPKELKQYRERKIKEEKKKLLIEKENKNKNKIVDEVAPLSDNITRVEFSNESKEIAIISEDINNEAVRVDTTPEVNVKAISADDKIEVTEDINNEAVSVDTMPEVNVEVVSVDNKIEVTEDINNEAVSVDTMLEVNVEVVSVDDKIEVTEDINEEQKSINNVLIINEKEVLKRKCILKLDNQIEYKKKIVI